MPSFKKSLIVEKFQRNYLKEANNKTVETYSRVVSEPGSSNKKDYGIRKRKFKNKKHTERRKKTRKDIRAMRTESNRKYIKNLSNLELTNDQINLLSRGLKFVPTPITNETALRKQFLTDFKDFARRMRLQFIYHGKNKNIHPFYVKSNWEPPVQQSVTLSRRNQNTTCAHTDNQSYTQPTAK